MFYKLEYSCKNNEGSNTMQDIKEETTDVSKEPAITKKEVDLKEELNELELDINEGKPKVENYDKEFTFINCGKEEINIKHHDTQPKEDHELELPNCSPDFNIIGTMCEKGRVLSNKDGLLFNSSQTCKNMKNPMKQKVSPILHSDVRHFICDICGKSFKSKSALKRHLHLHYFESNTISFSCRICGKIFKSVSGLHQHFRAHTFVSKYTCDICGKSYRNKQNLTKHVCTHSKTSSYKCEICLKYLKSEYSLLIHMDIHKNSKLCNVCKKSVRSIMIHAQSHIDFMQKVCKVCNKLFDNCDNLFNHVLNHVVNHVLTQ